MRKLSLLVLLAVATPLAAEVHQATPLPELMARLGMEHHHYALPESAATIPWNPAAAVTVEATARTFNITARQFTFDISPSPFVVNQGDTVTINISVPSSDAASLGHGFFLENYSELFSTIGRGKMRTIQFVATTPGTFTFFCTESSCGTGHGDMNGVFIVNAVQNAAPAITAIVPTSGTTAGGMAVAITGTNFLNGVTVKFGSLSAVSISLNSSTSITAFTPAQSAGKVLVTVTNPDGQRATLDGYTYTGSPVPRRRAARH